MVVVGGNGSFPKRRGVNEINNSKFSDKTRGRGDQIAARLIETFSVESSAATELPSPRYKLCSQRG